MNKFKLSILSASIIALCSHAYADTNTLSSSVTGGEQPSTTLTAGTSTPPIAFNNLSLPSDLEGAFPATISFAQNIVIPQTPANSHDIFPHLTALRETLLLVKPQDTTLNQTVPLTVTGYSKDGGTLGTLSLDRPEQLPHHDAFLENINLDEVDFSDISYDNAVAISTNSKLRELGSDEDGQILHNHLQSSDLIEITLSDGNYTSHIYLPSGTSEEDYKNKTIKVQVNSSYSTTIHANGKTIKAKYGTTLVYKNYGNQWVTEESLATNKITYGHNFWSAILPAEWMQPGLKLAVSHGNNTGVLETINIGAPTETLMHTIDIGMLTPPRHAFTFATNKELHRDYFQKIPVSRLIVSEYEPLYLEKVVLPDGTVLNDHDPSTGGWHSGTMRGSIGKILVSHGINNANYGINSSSSVSESAHPYRASQLTAHNSRGKYANGVVVHGGSGGAGMVTLENSTGNEFSHEVGHNFGLGHYPGGATWSIHRPADEVNSAWGWDSYHKRFIANFFWNQYGSTSCCSGDAVPPFEGYKFNHDAMAGGVASSPLSAYTLYTPYSLKHIQDHLEGKAVFAKDSSTGFRKWNPATETMEEFENKEVISDQLYISDLGDINDDKDGSYIADKLKQYDLLSVSVYNGHWIGDIYLPDASMVEKGKVITLSRTSGWASRVHVNNDTITMKYGENRAYISDGTVWQEARDGNYLDNRVPTAYGVPVTTIVGYYDPQQKLNSYLYPALHGGYGFTYGDDSSSPLGNSCVLKVTFGDNEQSSAVYKLAKHRINDSNMNKIHVNVKQSDNPKQAEVICQGNTLATLTIEGPKSPLSYTVNGQPLL